MYQEKIKKDWAVRAYSFGILKDPPGKVWADFVHRTDELIVLAEGEIEIEIEIEGKSEQPTTGRECLFLLMLCTQLGMWVSKIMSGITDTKTR